MRVLYTVAAGLSLLAPAYAENLHLSADRYWVALASRPSLAEAIAVARQYPSLRPMVVSSVNGWFAVVRGPEQAKPGSGRSALDDMIKSEGVPKDAYFTRGDGYLDVVWTTSNSPVIASKAYDGKADTSIVAGGLTVQLSSIAADAGLRIPVARGLYDGKAAFAITVSDHPAATTAFTATVAYLDQSSPSPQVVLTYFWQGAHCCTVTKIATLRNDGVWVVADGEVLDGSLGYAFEHLNSQGSVEMTSRDQAFYYTFASYADSAAPIRVHKLIVDQIVDVTEEPQYKDYLVQDLANLEGAAKQDGTRWHNNGFLAGWVAAKILVGQGPDAWKTMLERYDRSPGFGPEECSTGQSPASCPDGKLMRVDFPIALKAFLVQHGYIHDVSLFPVPDRRSPANTTASSGSVVPPAMSRCVGSSDAARTLIYQSFVGRKIRGGETSDLVTLQNDTTVEAADPAIGRVVCAVSYDMNLRSLIDRLAEDGEAQRAAILSRLMRRAGPTASNRIKYSIKATAIQGRTFVELLP